MANWKILTDDGARLIWDEALAQFADCSPFQSFAWAEYRRALGWKPYRLAAFDDHNEVVAMLQAYVRRYPFGVGLMWGEGGPIGDLSLCDESLQSAMLRATGLKRIYCRFRCDRARNVPDVLRLSAQGWTLPWASLSSNFSMIIDLTQDEDALMAKTARSWRANVRRAGKNGLTIRPWRDPDAGEVLSVFESMQKTKGLDEQHSREEIAQLLANVGSQLVLYRCDDEQGRAISLGGAITAGHCANLWLMATSEQGRKVNAAFGIFWAVIQQCRRIGIRSFDLGGIDPVQNHGVYRFKKDSGATPIELLGEWDWASRPWLRWFGNWAIAQRSRLKPAAKALSHSSAATSETRPVAIATQDPAAVRAN